MLIVYNKETGAVLDNHGTNSAMPEGPPDDRALLNLPGRTLADVGLLRLHDEKDADLVKQLLANEHTVDVKTKRPVVGRKYPELTPIPDPRIKRAEEIKAATTLEELKTVLIGHLNA